jgi:hypothetical protein
VNRAVALAKRTDDAGRFTHRTRDRFLAQFLHSNGIADAPSLVRSLATLDGATLREQVRRAANDFGWSIDACGYVFRTMERAASNPAVDHDGSFARVHHAIPRAWVCAHGGSWLLEQPVGLLRLCQSLSESDARHVLDMARALTEDRVIASSLTAVARDRVRVVGSASQRLRRVVQVVRCVGLLHDTPVAELLRRDADPNHLVDVVARGMAYLNRHVAGRSGVHTTKVRTQAEMFLLHVQMLVRAGLFEPRIASDVRLPMPRLHAAMFCWENRHPEWYSATPSGPRRAWDKGELDPDALRRLLHAATTREETAYLRLSAATGLRAAAVARLTLAAVWDPRSAAVRPVVALDEKNSDVRRLHMASLPDDVSRALADFLRHEHPGAAATPFVFYNRRCPWRPAWRYAAVTLQRLCKRAGLPQAFHHHQFRRFIVNHHMAHAGRLEDVAKFLGHRSTAITYNHYWTDGGATGAGVTLASLVGTVDDEGRQQHPRRPDDDDDDDAMHLREAFEAERRARVQAETAYQRALSLLTDAQRAALSAAAEPAAPPSSPARSSSSDDAPSVPPPSVGVDSVAGGDVWAELDRRDRPTFVPGDVHGGKEGPTGPAHVGVRGEGVRVTE